MKTIPLSRLIFSLALLAGISLACTLPFSVQTPVLPATAPADSTNLPPTPLPSTPIPPTDIPPTAVPPTADPLSLCPIPTADTSLYIHQENGFCLLYPNGFELQTNPQEPGSVTILGRILNPGAMESVRVALIVKFTGPADGLDSASYATRYEDLYLYGQRLPDDEMMIGTQTAVLLHNVPSMFGEQRAFVVANGWKYQLLLSPQPQDFPELADEANLVWNTVTGSFVFIPPTTMRQWVRPGDVCPVPSGGTLAYARVTEGWCLLYPDDFSPDPSFEGSFIGGPVLTNMTGFGDVRTSLTMGTLGYFPDRTPRQLAEDRAVNIDVSSIQDITIAGWPAATYRYTAGPWDGRDALISVDGYIYTIAAQPWEPSQWPLGMDYLERVWNTVTGSLAFFDRWE